MTVEGECQSLSKVFVEGFLKALLFSARDRGRPTHGGRSSQSSSSSSSSSSSGSDSDSSTGRKERGGARKRPKVTGPEGGVAIGGGTVEVRRKQRCKDYDSKSMPSMKWSF